MSASIKKFETGGTLLVVDDEASVRKRLRRIFEGAGHRVLTASDGPGALSLLHKEHCDLVVLDAEMPGVDGLALCRLLRAQAATKQLPVIMLSSSDDEQRKVEAFSAGADDYIVKPSSPGEILSRARAHLGAAQREWALVGINRELQFLADLGRGLLRAHETEQGASRRWARTMRNGRCALRRRLEDGREEGGGLRLDREGSRVRDPSSTGSL